MHDHETLVVTSSSGINSMTVMWLIMGLMAVHHIFMWVDMKKMKKQKRCSCK